MSDRFDIQRSRQAVEAIKAICSRRGYILALMQNNPDPDALASAAAFRAMVHELVGRRVTIGYAGACGRAENQAMMHALHIDCHKLAPSDISRYGIVCLVDAQPRSGNNPLSRPDAAEMVVDHHQLPKRRRWVSDFSDVRPEYGATSTIFYEYLTVMGITPDTRLATALFYGIQTDTQELGREACGADLAAFQNLVGLADMKKLARIRRAPLPRDYFRRLVEGVSCSEIAGSTVIACIESDATPEMIAEISDIMLRLEGARSSVCYGLAGDAIYLSARALDARGNVDQRLKRVVRRIGTGGGHRSMAGAQVIVEGDPRKRLQLVRARILKVFAPNKSPEPLLDADHHITGDQP